MASEKLKIMSTTNNLMIVYVKKLKTEKISFDPITFLQSVHKNLTICNKNINVTTFTH